MNRLEEFATFLAVSGPGLRARRVRDQIGQKEAERLTAYWRGRVTTVGAHQEHIVAELGKPTERSDARLGYDLGSPFGYLYVFEFDEQGRSLTSGFERIELRDSPRAFPAAKEELAEFVAALATCGATRSELRRWYGPPLDEIGWWPVETWIYSNGVVIELRHGIVEAPSEAPE